MQIVTGLFLMFYDLLVQIAAKLRLYIFFGIHTANVVQLAERLIDQQLAEAA